MIVNTSVWIEGLRGSLIEQVRIITEFIKANRPIYITPTIVQEVLQGVRDDSRYELVKKGMLAHTVLALNPVEAAVESALLYRALRKKGLTIRKPNNCLIAHYAIFYTHNDTDFDQIARFTALRIANT